MPTFAGACRIISLSFDYFPMSIIFGHHPVAEALESGATVEKVLLRQGIRPERIMAQVRKREIPVQYVPDVTLDRLAKGGNHQGVLAYISAVTYQNVEEVLLALQEKGANPLFVMLDGVTDVRNFGAIVRTAECMGAHAIIVPASGSAPANGEAVKASAGALLRLPLCRTNHLADSIMLLQSYGVAIVALSEKAADSLFDADLSGPLCLLLGSEDRGVSGALLRRVERLVRIPMQGKIASLNVSVAAGMALLETSRQRG